MRKDEFKKWLKKRLKERPVSDCISRCGRIERSLSVDLDKEYLRDKGDSLIKKLTYSVQDERENKPLPKGIEFKEGAHVYQGLTDLRGAARRYFNFCKYHRP